MAVIHKVILVKQCKGPGGVIKPAGTVVEGPNAHRLVELGVARPYEEEVARLAHIARVEQIRAAEATESKPAEAQAAETQPAVPEEQQGETPNGDGNEQATGEQSQNKDHHDS